MSDLFVNKATKKFFDDFEEMREKDNSIPKYFIDMPWEQVERINRFIQEETKRNSYDK